MKRSSLFVFGNVSLLFAGIAGCNAILDNREAVLDEDDAGAALTVDGSTGVDGTTNTVPGEDASVPESSMPEASEELDAAVETDAGEFDAGVLVDGGTTCPAGKKLCFGECVSVSDPLYGCATASCSPCSLNRAAAVCAGGKCAVGACNTGYANCNGVATDGCETDLAKATHCGTCNSVCGGVTPLCSATGGGFTCMTGCPTQAPSRCGDQCVNLTTSVSNCGQCGNACPAVANGQVACTTGNCRFTCNPGFHACGSACASNNDPATCGTRCSPCPAPANATATCSAGQCGFACNAGFHRCGDVCVPNDAVATCGASCTPCAAPANAAATCTAGACGITCNAGFGNCDTNAANGCEAAFASDPNHCGNCATVCPGTACVNGVCQAPPPPPQDAGTD